MSSQLPPVKTLNPMRHQRRLSKREPELPLKIALTRTRLRRLRRPKRSHKRRRRLRSLPPVNHLRRRLPLPKRQHHLTQALIVRQRKLPLDPEVEVEAEAEATLKKKSRSQLRRPVPKTRMMSIRERLN